MNEQKRRDDMGETTQWTTSTMKAVGDLSSSCVAPGTKTTSYRRAVAAAFTAKGKANVLSSTQPASNNAAAAKWNQVQWVPYASMRSIEVRESVDRAGQDRQQFVSSEQREVRALPHDVPGTTNRASEPFNLPKLVQVSSDPKRLERMAESRQQRHEQAYAAYQIFRRKLDQDLKAEVEVICTAVRTRARCGLDLIERKFEQLHKPGALGVIGVPEMDALKAWVLEQHDNRVADIKGLANALEEIESRRKTTVEATLQEVVFQLTRLGHLSPPGIQALFQEEITHFNIHLIRNRCSREKLLCRMSLAEVSDRAQCLADFNRIQDEWRQHRHRFALEAFFEKFQHDEFQMPTARRVLFNEIQVLQAEMKKACLAQLQVLMDTTPSQLELEKVREISLKLRQCHVDSDAKCQALMVDCRQFEDSLYGITCALVHTLGDELRSIGAMDEEAIALLLTNACMQPVESRHAEVIFMLGKVDRQLAREEKVFHLPLRRVCAFYGDLAQRWKQQGEEVNRYKFESEQMLAEEFDKQEEILFELNFALREQVGELALESDAEALQDRFAKVMAMLSTPNGSIHQQHVQFARSCLANLGSQPRQLRLLFMKHMVSVGSALGLTVEEEEERLAKQAVDDKARQAIVDEEEKEKREQEALALAALSKGKKGSTKKDSISSSGRISPAPSAVKNKKQLAQVAEEKAAQEAKRVQEEEARTEQERQRKARRERLVMLPSQQLRAGEGNESPQTDGGEGEAGLAGVDKAVVFFEEEKVLDLAVRLLKVNDRLLLDGSLAGEAPVMLSARQVSASRSRKEEADMDAYVKNDGVRFINVFQSVGFDETGIEASMEMAEETITESSPPLSPSPPPPVVEGLAAVGDGSEGKKGSDKKKKKSTTKKLSKRQQQQLEAEAALAKAMADEAGAKALVKAKAEARRKAELSPAVDKDGLLCVLEVHFDPRIFAQVLTEVRTTFLQELVDTCSAEVTTKTALCSTLADQVSIELDENLRKHKPRQFSVEVEVYQKRSEALQAHYLRFETVQTTMQQRIALIQAQFDVKLRESKECFHAFVAWAEAAVEQLKMPGLFSSLASLQAVVLTFQKQRKQVKTELFAQVKALTDMSSELKRACDSISAEHLMDCVVFEGAYGEERSRLVWEQTVDVDARGELKKKKKSSRKRKTSKETKKAEEKELAEQAAAVLNAYSYDEKALYVSKHNEAGKMTAQALSSMHSQLSELLYVRDSVETLACCVEFEKQYKLAEKRLSLDNGLGYKNGAPKRALGASVLRESMYSREQEAWIDTLLAKLKGLCSVSEPDQAKEHFNKQAQGEKTQGEDGVIQQESGVLSVEVLGTLEQLKHELYARADYLQLLRPSPLKFPPSVFATPPVVVANTREKEKSGEKKSGKKHGKKESSASSILPTALKLLGPSPLQGGGFSLLPSIDPKPVLYDTLSALAQFAQQCTWEVEAREGLPSSQNSQIGGTTSRPGSSNGKTTSSSNSGDSDKRKSNGGNSKEVKKGKGGGGEVSETSVAPAFLVVPRAPFLSAIRNSLNDFEKEVHALTLAAWATDTKEKAENDAADEAAMEANGGKKSKKSGSAEKKNSNKSGSSKKKKGEIEDIKKEEENFQLSPALFAHYATEWDHAVKSLHASVATFRVQVDAVYDLLPACAIVMFSNLRLRNSLSLKALAPALSARFAERFSAVDSVLLAQKQALGPAQVRGISLGRLEELCVAADKDFAAANELRASYATERLQAYGQHASLFLSRLQHTASTAMSVFDMTVAPLDLLSLEAASGIGSGVEVEDDPPRSSLPTVLLAQYHSAATLAAATTAAQADGGKGGRPSSGNKSATAKKKKEAGLEKERAELEAQSQIAALPARLRRGSWEGVPLSPFALSPAAAVRECRMKTLASIPGEAAAATLAEETALADAEAAATALEAGKLVSTHRGKTSSSNGRSSSPSKNGRSPSPDTVSAPLPSSSLVNSSPLAVPSFCPLTGLKIPSNRAVIECKEALYSEYLVLYQQTQDTILAEYATSLIKAHQIHARWLSDVEHARDLL